MDLGVENGLSGIGELISSGSFDCAGLQSAQTASLRMTKFTLVLKRAGCARRKGSRETR
jgi:hypothetical protein